MQFVIYHKNKTRQWLCCFPLGVIHYVMMYCVSQHDAELTCCLFSGVYFFLFNFHFEPEITVNSGAFKLSHNCVLGSVLSHPDQASLFS